MNILDRKIFSALLCVGLAVGMSGCGSKSESSDKQPKDFSKMDSSSDIFKAPPIVIAGDGMAREIPLSEMIAKSKVLESVPPVELPRDLVAPAEPIQLGFRPGIDENHDYDMLVIRELTDEDDIYHRHDLVQTSFRRTETDQESVLALEMETRRVKISFDKDPKNLAYDTMNPIVYSGEFASSVAGMLQAAIEEPLLVTTDEQGSKVDVAYPSALEEALAKSPGAAAVGTDDAFLYEAVRQCIVPLPANPVSAGDTWESIGNWSRFGPEITLKSTYKLEGLAVREGVECAVISYETVTEGDASPDTRFENLGFSMQGIVFVEVKTGQLVELINEGSGSTDLDLPETPTRTCGLEFRTKLIRVDS